MDKIKLEAKGFIDANVWDGEYKTWSKSDWAKFSPDDLQKLVFDVVDHLLEIGVIQESE